MKNRKIVKYVCIKNSLQDCLHCAKKGYESQARNCYYETMGMIRYMSIAGDISEFDYERIRNLLSLIRKKYHIY